jgi:hypothetical protein
MMKDTQQLIARSVGAGLAGYGVGTAIAMMASGSPGGDYSERDVRKYISFDHFWLAAGLWYVAALSAIGLLVAAIGLRSLPRSGGLLAALAQTGAAVSIAGAFVSGGIAVAAAEGGNSVRTGVPHPVVYTITEIGNLLAVCAPALCVGVAALVAARSVAMPAWLRAFTFVAGVCGILAPAFFTYFVFVLWTIVAGIAIIVQRAPRAVAEPAASVV